MVNNIEDGNGNGNPYYRSRNNEKEKKNYQTRQMIASHMFLKNLKIFESQNIQSIKLILWTTEIQREREGNGEKERRSETVKQRKRMEIQQNFLLFINSQLKCYISTNIIFLGWHKIYKHFSLCVSNLPCLIVSSYCLHLAFYFLYYFISFCFILFHAHCHLVDIPVFRFDFHIKFVIRNMNFE